ncbi:hypothetical protein [Mesorhizobium sp. NZP2298]|uniref:hypothetical protein n=1 Tax=Mesorhizobium sp. NZP2298 TaxID=2483403 RepID=UPI0019D5DAB3|nr:hypothetical protein [Mesorhizobium sp. NZP2298]
MPPAAGALLVGALEGPDCIRFAVDHSDRLSGLVLWGSCSPTGAPRPKSKPSR